MPATGAAARPPLLVDEDSFFDWMQLHIRELLIALLVVIIAAGGVFLYRSASATQAAQAEQALVGPEQSLQAGNVPLAQSDLRRVMTRYANTQAAAQAAMLLADTYYRQGKYAEGVAALQQASTSGAAKPFGASIERLIADGYIQQGKAKEAAAHSRCCCRQDPVPDGASAAARKRRSSVRERGRHGGRRGDLAIVARSVEERRGERSPAHARRAHRQGGKALGVAVRRAATPTRAR